VTDIVESPIDVLRRKRAQWLDCLSGKDRNSIMQQIYSMIWNAAAFRIVIEARRLAPRDSNGQPQLGGLMHALLDRSFFDSQAVTIRRLTDGGYDIDDPKRGIYSLGALIRDLLKHAPLFARENMFAAEHLPYDYVEIRRRWFEYDRGRGDSREATFVPRELDWSPSESRHEQIDRLAGVRQEERRPNDLCRVAVLDELTSRLKECAGDFKKYVDKFLAHAASPESRLTINADEVELTFGHLWQAQQVVCEIANYVSVHWLGGPQHAFLATMTRDRFQYLDQPLVSAEDMSKLRKAWDSFEVETREWAHWII
jgi:hypothetical protein